MSFLRKLFLGGLEDHSAKINDYFANAVRVYALKNDYDARCAALAAAKVAASIQRSSMVKYLLAMI